MFAARRCCGKDLTVESLQFLSLQKMQMAGALVLFNPQHEALFKTHSCKAQEVFGCINVHASKSSDSLCDWF